MLRKVIERGLHKKLNGRGPQFVDERFVPVLVVRFAARKRARPRTCDESSPNVSTRRGCVASIADGAGSVICWLASRSPGPTGPEPSPP